VAAIGAAAAGGTVVAGMARAVAITAAGMVDPTAVAAHGAAVARGDAGVEAGVRCLCVVVSDPAMRKPKRICVKTDHQNKNGVVISHNAVCQTIYCLNSLGWLMGLNSHPFTSSLILKEKSSSNYTGFAEKVLHQVLHLLPHHG
jgi:hypothetical protein